MYLSYIDNTYATKNRLENAVMELIRKNDRTLIIGDDVELFKEQIIAGIEKLNDEFKRCTPLKAYWDSGYGSKEPTDFYLRTGQTICRFCLYKIRKEYPNES